MSLKQKTTPGPWTFDGRETSGCYKVSDSTKYWTVARAEKESDARLIASAPSLLVTLQACKASLDIYGSSDPNGVALIELIDKTLKAVRE